MDRLRLGGSRLSGCTFKVVLVAAVAATVSAGGTPAGPTCEAPTLGQGGAVSGVRGKNIDEPNPLERQRLLERWRLVNQSQRGWPAAPQVQAFGLAAEGLAKVGHDRVLVILVEFAGTDTFTWTKGVSTWDPLGKADGNEVVRDAQGNIKVGDCSLIINQTRTFTYSGPLHNRIQRPLSAADVSGTMIWTPDFAPSYYASLIYGDGVVYDYARQDGSSVYRSLLGRSVRGYYEDMSNGRYTFDGQVVGWVQVPHSVWWYGADPCPGARSGSTTATMATSGAIPGAGSDKRLVIDALEAVKAAYPALDWASFDTNHDGVIDRLWIVHAGLGEDDSTTLLNRTDYGEAQIWSHSSSLSPAYEVVPGVKAGPYIMMPEDSGISVYAHEYGHNLGAIDLYSYGGGDTSAGFWTVMADDWTGFPIGGQPPAFDPWHLEGWGWLDPLVITDPTKVYTPRVGQASAFPAGEGVYRGVKIILPDQQIPLPVVPHGAYEWWGGSENLLSSTMTSAHALAIPPGGATLSFSLAFDTEAQWDFLWVQVSDDGGASWRTLTNLHTRCDHDPDWIGGSYGFPANLCAAGIGGFSGRSVSYPAFQTETFSLAPFAGRSVLLRLWYMTDWGTLGAGAFVDDVAVRSGASTLLSDGAETDSGEWSYAGAWSRVASARSVPHAYYLQWRNVKTGGGYDEAIGDPLFRYGPGNTGLLVWYNDDRYPNNEIRSYLNDPPGFGPKGKMLVVDAHPEPYRSPGWLAAGYDNEAADATTRQQMRDAPFSLHDTVPFTLWGESYVSRPAVPVFDDSLGYYPGAEHVSRGPGYSPAEWIWATAQWDASTVIPSLVSYGIKAPGYHAADPLSYRCVAGPDGTTSCSVIAGGLGYDGSDGNPGDVGGAFGWRVEILSEVDSEATLRISNDRSACVLACDATAPEFAAAGVAAPFAIAETVTGCAAAVARQWEFGDGGAGSAAVAPSHVFSHTGSYTWRVTASGGGQVCTRTGFVTVGNGAAARVTVGGAPIADGQAAPVAFGSVPRGVQGPTRVFTVANLGDIPLSLGAVSLPAGYTLVEQLSRELAPYQQDTFTVRLDSGAPGVHSGAVSFTTNDADAAVFDFPISGTITAPVWRLDFGTAGSPVAAGYTGVSPSTRYSEALGYGWASGAVDARDRSSGDSLTRDFNFTAYGTFAVDLPDGAYLVTVTMGDATGAHDQMGVFLQGARVDTVSTTAKQVAVRSYRVGVGGGQLELTLQDLGGTDSFAVINALVVAPAPPSRRLPPHGKN